MQTLTTMIILILVFLVFGLWLIWMSRRASKQLPSSDETKSIFKMSKREQKRFIARNRK